MISLHSPGSWYFHAVEAKGALAAAGLAVGNDVGVFAALFDGERSDAALFRIAAGSTVEDIQCLAQVLVFFENAEL